MPHRQIRAKIEPINGFRNRKFSMMTVGETSAMTTVLTSPKVEMAIEKINMNLSGETEGM